MVVGALAVAGVGGIALLLGAVTFLGTTEERPRARDAASAVEGGPAGSGPAGSGNTLPARDDSDAAGEAEAGRSWEDMPLSERAAWSMAEQLAPEWAVVVGEPVALDAQGACQPEGWHDGATDRFRVGFMAAGIGEAEVRTIAYETEAHAQADLERASSDEIKDCLAEASADVVGSDPSIEMLPFDATVPGLTYRLSGNGYVQDHTYIVVGRVRAYVTFCTCAGMDEQSRHRLAQDIAKATAAAQDLPAPG